MMLTAKLVDRPYKVPRDVLYIQGHFILKEG
jgi:hypothetical protein